jgi:two-component sensor histidine kinase
VAVGWTVTIEAKRRTLNIDWTESGGPPVRPPTRHGFGTRLLEFVLPGQIQATSTVEYLPQGIHVRCVVPLLLSAA